MSEITIGGYSVPEGTERVSFDHSWDSDSDHIWLSQAFRQDLGGGLGEVEYHYAIHALDLVDYQGIRDTIDHVGNVWLDDNKDRVLAWAKNNLEEDQIYDYDGEVDWAAVLEEFLYDGFWDVSIKIVAPSLLTPRQINSYLDISGLRDQIDDLDPDVKKSIIMTELVQHGGASALLSVSVPDRDLDDMVHNLQRIILEVDRTLSDKVQEPVNQLGASHLDIMRGMRGGSRYVLYALTGDYDIAYEGMPDRGDEKRHKSIVDLVLKISGVSPDDWPGALT